VKALGKKKTRKKPGGKNQQEHYLYVPTRKSVKIAKKK